MSKLDVIIGKQNQSLALAQQAQVGCGGSWVKQRKARICMEL